jgi:hypothetical protein
MKAHRIDRVSLAFGLVFLVIVGFWLIARTVDVRLPAVGWFVAGGLILFGLLGLVGSLRSGRTSQPVSAEPDTAAVDSLEDIDET